MKHLQTLAVAALLALGAGTASAASCTSSFNLGSMGPPAGALLGNTFTSAGTFTDCYSFSLNAPAQALGVTLEYDLMSMLNIDITTIALSGGSLVGSVVGNFATPLPGGTGFSFSSLAAGVYELAISGTLTNQWGIAEAKTGYFGGMTTAPVPEPETYAMMALGLGLAAFAARRGQKKA